MSRPWICCQLGAREHYSIPRALRRSGDLGLLITDLWSAPGRPAPTVQVKQRYHAELQDAPVVSMNLRALAFESGARVRWQGWERIQRRNAWFQRAARPHLDRFRRRFPDLSPVLFSYSYAARELFLSAKRAGWPTVLGQIDPGPFEERLVSNLHKVKGAAQHDNPAPPGYWEHWREECRLADRIVVNSEWSRQALCAEGISASKIRVVPLAYDLPPSSMEFSRNYPARFDPDRPLRVLFLGQLNLRKGIAEILAAIPRLEHLPIEFWMVGPVQIPVPDQLKEHPKIRWIGSVPRGSTSQYYRDADVFLFPTFSDGFGLTQLEAQAWNLPIIASSHCGEVVRHLGNGYLLPEINSAAIIAALCTLTEHPEILNRLSGGTRRADFTLKCLSSALATLAEEV